MNIYTASNQWATRPADERFWTLEEMAAAARSIRAEAAEAVVPANSLRFLPSPDGRDIMMHGEKGIPARVLHYSFGQACRLVEAPAEYLRRLPTETACDLLNMGLRERSNGLNVLFRRNGAFDVRSLTGETYARIWNSDVVSRLLPLTGRGWRVPPARPAVGDVRARLATAEDVEGFGGFDGLSVTVGDPIAPAGLYLSDKDVFVFMVNPARTIDAGGRSLMRGFFVQNSEVGDCAYKVHAFLLDHVCGNHIVWGAKTVLKVKVVHRGNRAEYRARTELENGLRRYADMGTEMEARAIAAARAKVLGKDKAETVETLFNKRIETRSVLEKAFDAADAERDSNAPPNTAWGMVQGLTRVSQGTPYADARVKVDRACEKVMRIAF